MKRLFIIVNPVIFLLIVAGCHKSYQAKPLSFKMPASYNNAANVAGAQVAAIAFSDPKQAEDAFGFDIRGAGMFPVEVIFDNQGAHPLEIDGAQTFLEDRNGNLWPLLSKKLANERAAKYTKTKETAKGAAGKSLLGAAAGAVIGAAIGIIAGENVGEAIGKGAAAGAAAGAVIGGTAGYISEDAQREIANDLREKSLQNNGIKPGTLAYGFLFFPGEADLAIKLRLKLVESDTGNVHVINFDF